MRPLASPTLSSCCILQPPPLHPPTPSPLQSNARTVCLGVNEFSRRGLCTGFLLILLAFQTRRPAALLLLAVHACRSTACSQALRLSLSRCLQFHRFVLFLLRFKDYLLFCACAFRFFLLQSVCSAILQVNWWQAVELKKTGEPGARTAAPCKHTVQRHMKGRKLISVGEKLLTSAYLPFESRDNDCL